jgi:hypothetical protein
LQEENVRVCFNTVDDIWRCQQNAKHYYHEV